MNSRAKPTSWTSHLASLTIALTGVAIALLTEWQGSSTGEFSMLGAFVGPSFAVVGTGLVLLPGYHRERREQGLGAPVLQVAALLTPHSWSLLALLAGLANVGHLAAGG